MKDSYGRETTNLRISLTQRCNLDCFYCHQEGEEGNKKTSLKAEEVKRIVETATDLGMHKVKYSGGEPLLHPELEKIIDHSSHYMDDVSITTNGVFLKEKAERLKRAGLDRANVSLDTVDSKTYEEITGVAALEKVKSGVKKAVEVGLFPVKLNMLLLDGLNDDEVWDMVDWASGVDAILQVIELTGNEEEVEEEFYQEYHHSLKDLASKLEEKAKGTKRRKMHARKKYFLKDPEVEVELVRSMHNSTFCMNCTRLRVTSEGELKPCLLRKDNHVSMRKELEEGKGIKDKFIEAIQKREPYWCERQG
ncbi:MAG: GTP 3',8-cyclase MoaA [Candidatus Thermoplasmatota archaeon]